MATNLSHIFRRVGGCLAPLRILSQPSLTATSLNGALQSSPKAALLPRARYLHISSALEETATNADASPKKARKASTKQTKATKNATSGEAEGQPNPKKLTSEEKMQQKAEEMRKLALSPPSYPRRHSAYNSFIAEKASITKDISEAFKALTPEEKAKYNDMANKALVKKKEEYEGWLDQHTPQDIDKANAARKWLRRHVEDDTGKYHPIADSRLPKRNLSAYNIFVKERVPAAVAINPGEKITTVLRTVASEWKKLPGHEKKAYQDMEERDAERYKAQRQLVFGSS